MTLQYTPRQLDKEIRLVLSSLTLIVDRVLGEGAGVAALREALSDADAPVDLKAFDQSPHPAMLPEDLSALPFAMEVARLDAYVARQQWSPNLRHDIAFVQQTLDHTLPADLRVSLEAERLSSPPFTGDIEQDIAEGFEVPFGYFYSGILPALLPLAAARLKMDSDELLTLAEVAILADTKEANVIAAAHRKRFDTVEVEGRRMAEPKHVLEWLIAAGYLPTQRTLAATPKTAAKTEFVFVPVARDGSAFLPDVRSAGRYTIGAKGDEQKVADYFEALALLTAMPTPRWRRPNSEGNRGIVAGIDFHRVPRERIDHMLHALQVARR